MRDPDLLGNSVELHDVVFARSVRWVEAQDQMVWLATHPDTRGVFVNGRRWVCSGGIRQERTWYAFTDMNTAILFRLNYA